MGFDPLSPVAPARVRMLLLPIGRVKRSRFSGFVERLRPESVVRLGDISPDGRPNRNMFSPLAFPAGMILYDLTTSLPLQSHMNLSPFEVHREPLIVVALADGEELGQNSYRNSTGSQSDGGGILYRQDRHIRELDQELERLRDQYPKALVHRLLIFDYHPPSKTAKLPEGLVGVPPSSSSNLTTIKTIMCDISSMFLAEMTTSAKSLQGISLIESPNKARGLKADIGSSWSMADTDAFSRRSSQASLPGNEFREDSPTPGGSKDRNHVRMSMPALRSANSDPYGASPSASPSTPKGESPITESNPNSKSPPSTAVSRLTSTDKFRTHSRDRISVQGFGSGSLSDRSRIKGKGRINIVLGTMYLQAGRWPDALRELQEGASMAYSINDHLWHAKSLENIVIAMLMLAWAGMDFQISELLYASAEKAPYHTPPSSAMGQKNLPTRLVSLQNLANLLPELLNKILYIYGRASNFAGEELPQLPFSETVIRFSHLLTSIHMAGGKITDSALQDFVDGSSPIVVASVQPNARPSRAFVAEMLFKSLPTLFGADEELSVIDRAIVMGGVASVLDSLGYYRKKALVMRELVSILTPGLIQARKIGAAEMGIHPAAGLTAFTAINGSANGTGALEIGEGDIESGMDELLSLMGRLYGVVSFENTSRTKKGIAEKFDESDEATISRIMNNATMRAFGGQNLKMNVLRACINLAEALPDFNGVLKFSTDLLRTAGSGIAPGPRTESASPSVSREEQMHLASNITRTVSAAKKLGLSQVEAEYWDEFLVRGVDLDTQPSSRSPILHQKSELEGTTAASESRERNPFIYNPFIERASAAPVNNMLVAGESANFKVSLQNPYEFDIDIESICLETDMADFDSGTQSTLIGPYRTQIMTITGTPRTAGALTIKGCYVKVRGCRERRFPIFADPWTPQSNIKVKSIGLTTMQRRAGPIGRPLSTSSISGPPLLTTNAPKPTTLKINVIEEQPLVIVKSVTLPQSAAMVLEGESQTFSVVLENLSSTTAADLLLFTFVDSTQVPLQTALSNREASPSELYEYELILATKQALRWIKRSGEVPYIASGGTSTFDFEILGKPGLTNAIIQVDYAHLGVPQSEAPSKFYTRKTILPLTVTVNASVELVRMDVLSFVGDIPSHFGMFRQDKISADEKCLFVLDLRNAWPNHLQVRLELENEKTVEEDILPGNTSRIVFPVKRMLLDHPYASIPTLDPARARQFVVSTGKISADAERATREAFWYREEILKSMKGSWKTLSGYPRHGSIELRGMRLAPRMIDALKIEEVGIELNIGSSRTDSETTAKKGHPNEVLVDEFLTIKARVTNHSTQDIHPLLRVQLSLRHHSHTSAPDLAKKIVADGTLQHTIPVLQAQETVEVNVRLAALCRGEFEIGASVEEVRFWNENEDTKGDGTLKKSDGQRPRANTKTMMDSVLGKRERRIWHARMPCVIVVRDEDEDNEEADGGSTSEDGQI